MEESSNRLVKLILGEIALLFILVVIAAYLGRFLGAESFKDVLLELLPPAVTVIFVLIATLLFISILQPFFLRALSRFLSSQEANYTWQFIKYAIWIASLLILAFVLVGDITSIGILLGILFLIIIIMFYKAFINFAGWLHIIFQHRLRIGDLVEVEGIKGKIVGITIMNTKLIETAQFMGEDHYTNREVLIPNSFVFTSPIFTISPKRSLVWDEIKVLLPAKTDHLMAKDLITQVGNSIAGPIMRKYRQEMIKNSSSSDNIPSMPSLMLSFEPEGLMIILTYFCPISERNEVRTAISENIIKEFKKEGIDIAFRDSHT
ncbi:MAG: mechanosensitive ion channel family protein [Thermoplasmata archaeon]|nr:MAG: mechanosensitive ion channel family protein [Thermoplasmata archaeon]